MKFKKICFFFKNWQMKVFYNWTLRFHKKNRVQVCSVEKCWKLLKWQKRKTKENTENWQCAFYEQIGSYFCYNFMTVLCFYTSSSLWPELLNYVIKSIKSLSIDKKNTISTFSFLIKGWKDKIWQRMTSLYFPIEGVKR